MSPSLALYVHIPWCVRKCPYCDFNSHAQRSAIPEAAYVDTLLRDLEQDLGGVPGRVSLTSLFIGGGTPSLFSGEAVTRLLQGIRQRVDLTPTAEITLEANPGTADAGNLSAYRESGVNRLSIGAQSLSAEHLERLGRIHGPREVVSTVVAARRAGFDNLNLDLMYGLPDQGLEQARRDLEQALDLGPEHISYYQLTLEPNTAFHAAPPPLPGDDAVADMHQQGIELLRAREFTQYEVSAYALPGRRCEHNLGYWRFGDYLGIGAGAHGKLSNRSTGIVERYAKRRHPTAYLDPANRHRLVDSRRILDEDDLVLEFAMNALRLVGGFERSLFAERTGLPFERIAPRIQSACDEGLLRVDGDLIRPTEQGRWFLDHLLQRFVADL